MAMKFMKKAAEGQTTAPAPQAAPKPAAKPAEAKKTGAMAAFLKHGAAAKQALEAEESKAELAKQQAGKLWRFRMGENEERRITFLDGDLDADGMIDAPLLYEHQVNLNGNWKNFVCTAEQDQTQPCPICETGTNKPALVAVLTVIDHSEYTIEKGQKKGQVMKNQKRLFVCKRTTLNLLRKFAQKRDGLAGCTFDVSRVGDKTPAVGNQFDFVEKHDSAESIADKYGIPLDEIAPADYSEEIQYNTPEQLIELGVGKAISNIQPGKTSASKDMSEQL